MIKPCIHISDTNKWIWLSQVVEQNFANWVDTDNIYVYLSFDPVFGHRMVEWFTSLANFNMTYLLTPDAF